MEKRTFLTYIYLFILAFSLTSCENEDNSHIKDIEGHWLHAKTQINIEVLDIKKKDSIENHIKELIDNKQISYEFKNDKTYYYHSENTDPIKGKVTTLDKNYFQIEDIRGNMKVLRGENEIYVLSDIKREIIKQLEIPENEVLKVEITEIFKKGLTPNSLEKK